MTFDNLIQRKVDQYKEIIKQKDMIRKINELRI